MPKQTARQRIDLIVRLSPELAALAERWVRVLEASGAGGETDEEGAVLRPRARRGVLDVFRGDYVPFVIVALDTLGGRAKRKAIIDEARNVLGDRLRSDDLKRVSERKRLPRWRYRLGWALQRARQLGYLKRVKKERGVRLLTAEGKIAAAQARKNIEREEI